MSDEIRSRYLQARDLLNRIVLANGKPHWDDGESFEEAIKAAGEWLCYEKLSDSIESDMKQSK